ncbi:(2Fe-2S)-binding protein [Actinacidiphila rubida]|uniref:FhuF 2Fe-2S C-terminal domain-containing protein n=1 Tax=Actinacidiphila rubida TaxID=310780 RepID=A0A1H8RG86_9ACTN|nr:(2Fe-2S)-binding protein [Actinacidiphila rubida]SEO65277.1 FhuF 2Fe-2S C-terminal domain-containing protein [Actinacidiphila rubida]
MPATCSSSYERLSAAFPGLRVTAGLPPRGGGWVSAAELARGGPALAGFIAGGAERIEGEHGRAPRPDVAAGLALHRYLWPACLLFTVPWFLDGRVPRLPVEDVAFHPESGRFAVRTRQLTCLPGDRVHGGPDASVTVATPVALRHALRSALAEHLGPVLRGFAPHLRRGPRALWRTATDEVVEGLWYIAQLLGDEERAVADLGALLPSGSRFRAPGAQAAPCGPEGPSRTRLTCCLFYTVSPSGTCSGCPRTADAVRIRHPARAV